MWTLESKGGVEELLADGHDEQPRAPIFSCPRIADHGTLISVVDLRFSRCSDDHG